MHRHMRSPLSSARPAWPVLFVVITFFGNSGIVGVRSQEAYPGNSNYAAQTPTPQPPSDGQSSSRPSTGNDNAAGTTSFWSTAPGLLTGFAAVISAIAALLTALHHRKKADDR